MMRFIAFLMRLHMFAASKRGTEWWEIERNWHDAVDAQMDNVFEEVEDG